MARPFAPRPLSLEETVALMSFDPFADWVVVLADTGEMQTAAGIYVAEATDYKPGTGTVLAVGPSVVGITVGERILFSQFAAQALPLPVLPSDKDEVREVKKRTKLVRVGDTLGKYRG